MCARARGEGRKEKSERKEGGEEEERRRVFAEEDVAAPVQKASGDGRRRHEPERVQVRRRRQPPLRRAALSAGRRTRMTALAAVALRHRFSCFLEGGGGVRPPYAAVAFLAERDRGSGSPRGRLTLTFSRC